MWQISHEQIYADLELKAKQNPLLALEAIEYLERVHRGEDPNQILNGVHLSELPGETIEVLLKSYKWIWGQEDVNYPTGEGRDLSMKRILELMTKIQKT